MINEWAIPYEAPISLDGPRLIGTRTKRGTLWTFAAVGVGLALGVLAFMLSLPWLILPIGGWLALCQFMAKPIGQRMPEYWLSRWVRSRRHDTQPVIPETPLAVVQVTTLNLRLADEATLGGHIKRYHQLLLGLRFPIQILVRARQGESTVYREFYVAVTADTDELLAERVKDIIAGLKRSGLDGIVSTGTTWPKDIKATRHHAVADGEYVRGLLLARLPRTVEPNWLAAILDGELAADFSAYLEPLDNVDELAELSGRVSEWETAQVLNLGLAGTNGALGYRDPDIDEQIKDALRTRALLRQRRLRVYSGTIAFVVRGRTLAEMQERERLLVDHLSEHTGSHPVIPCDFEQDLAPMLAMPIARPAVQFPIRLVSPALARTYAFSNSSVNMEEGVNCGVSIGSRRENRINLWSLDNPHVVVLATTGAGKGYWVKVLLWRLLHQHPDRRVWIIEAEKDEYTALARAMLTRYGTFAAQDAIWSTETHSSNGNVMLAEVPMLRRAIPAAEWTRFMSEVIRIDHMKDLDDAIWRNRARYDLRGEQLTIYNLTRMDPADRGEATAKILRALDLAAEREYKPTVGHIVIDELGIVLESPAALSAIDTAYRRFRSIPHIDNPTVVSRRGMIGISQRPSDLLNRPQAKVLADLSETHYYLRQRSTEVRVVQGKLQLTDDEASFLESCSNGEGLLICGKARVAMKIEATIDEDAFART